MNFEELKKAILGDFSETSVFEVFQEGIDVDYLTSITGKFFTEESCFDYYEEKYAVIYFKEHDIYIKFTYIGSSYGMNDRCEMEEVFPEKKIKKKFYSKSEIAMTFDDIKRELSGNYDRIASHFLLGHNYITKEDIESTFGEVSLVDKYYDSYFEGDIYVILHFIEHDIFVKINGYNDSYSGVYWYNDIIEIEKKVETVTSYIEKD